MPRRVELDWMLGTWTGQHVDANGKETAARLRCKLLNKDCLVLDVLELRAPGAADWTQRLAVRGYIAQQGRWESWALTDHDTRMRQFQGAAEGDAVVFERTDPATGATEREVLVHFDPNHMQIETTRRLGDEEALVATIVLEREDS